MQACSAIAHIYNGHIDTLSAHTRDASVFRARLETVVQWLADRYEGPPREGSTKAGPRLYEPQGKRFTLLQGDSPSSRVFQ